jgi:hypothetical protein
MPLLFTGKVLRVSALSEMIEKSVDTYFKITVTYLSFLIEK